MKRRSDKKANAENPEVTEALKRVEILQRELAEALIQREKALDKKRGLTGDEAEAAKEELEKAAKRVDRLTEQQSEAARLAAALKREETGKQERVRKQKKTQKRKQAAKSERVVPLREPIQHRAPTFDREAADAADAFERHRDAIEQAREDGLEQKALEKERDLAARLQKKAQALERRQTRKRAKVQARAEAEALRLKEEREAKARKRQETSLKRKAEAEAKAQKRRAEALERKKKLQAVDKMGFAAWWSKTKSKAGKWLSVFWPKK